MPRAQSLPTVPRPLPVRVGVVVCWLVAFGAWLWIGAAVAAGTVWPTHVEVRSPWLWGAVAILAIVLVTWAVTSWFPTRRTLT